MLTRFARFLLVSTSLAPVAIVYGLSVLSTDVIVGAVAISLAALLTIICASLLRYLRKHGEHRTFNVASSQNADKEILAFLITYLLPLIARTEVKGNTIALACVVVLISIVVYRTDMIHVNPLIGLLGYRFSEVTMASGKKYLVVSRSANEPDPGSVTAIQIDPYVWLEV